MTDKHEDQLVRSADPYDESAFRDLHGADKALLEEIMSQPPIKQLIPRPRRRAMFAGIGLVVAATLAVALGAPSVVSNRNNGPEVATPTHGRSVDTNKGKIVYAAATIKAAEQNPRLFIDEPGWKVTKVYGFAKDAGTIAFTNGDRTVEMNWYPAADYDGYYTDRLDVSKPEPMTVDGQQGSVFRYSSTDLAIMLHPDGQSFAELRADGGWKDKPAILAAFAKVKKVDIQTWLAALPSEVVTPARASVVIDQITADMALPTGFNKAKYANLGTNDRYQFGVQVVSDVICSWLNEWERADKSDDRTAAKQAVDAIKDSRNWKILHEMDKGAGEFSQTIWMGISDQVSLNKDPAHFLEIISCE